MLRAKGFTRGAATLHNNNLKTRKVTHVKIIGSSDAEIDIVLGQMQSKGVNIDNVEREVDTSVSNTTLQYGTIEKKETKELKMD